MGANWRKDQARPYYGALYKISMDTGLVEGMVTYLTGPHTSSPAVVDGKVFIVAEEDHESYIYAYDLSLNPLWNHLVDETPRGRSSVTLQGTSPAVADGRVFVGNGQDITSTDYPGGDYGFVYAIW